MRVLYVSKALTVGAYRDKLRALAERVDVTAVIPQRWGSQPVAPIDTVGPPIRLLPAWFHGHNHFHLYKGIRAVVRDLRPELVHVDEEPYSAVTAQVMRACQIERVPALFFAWQNLSKRLPPPFGTLRRYVFGGVAGAIAGTDQAAVVLRRAGYRGRLVVVPQFGVDLDRFRPDPDGRARLRARLGLRDLDSVVGFGGRLVREKGVHLLIEALAPVPNAALVVMGDGPERGALERLAAERGMTQRVRFVGAIDSLNISDWLTGLDVLVLPSLSTPAWVEQFGRILVEAMSSGVAVVGARSGEIPNTIGDAGLTFPENDASALNRVISDLIGNCDSRERLGAAGRARAIAQYSHTAIAGRTVDFYQTIVSG